MKKTRISEQEKILKYALCDVWNIIVSQDSKWRSDLSDIEIIDASNWVEIDTYGNRTSFTIDRIEEFKQYDFHMENKRFSGEWYSTYEEDEQGNTKIYMKEVIHIKNPFMYLISLLFWDLSKIQITYLHDLEIALQENKTTNNI